MTGAGVMEFTGERFVPGSGGAQIAYEHLQRYLVASDAIAGRTVLDVACGEGYGAFTLARRARRVVGVDISDEACAHAAAKYATSNLHFVRASATRLPLRPASIDVAVCFETIEHVSEPELLIEEIKTVLTSGGLLILSTPNSETYSPDGNTRNPYHLHEFSKNELLDVTERHFRNVLLYGQRLSFGASIWALDRGGDDHIHHDIAIRPEQLAVSEAAPRDERTPLYFVALCSDADLPAALVKSSFELTDQDGLLGREFQSTSAAYAAELARLVDVVARREGELSRREAEAKQNDQALADARTSQALLRAELDRVHAGATWGLALRLRALTSYFAAPGTRRRRVLRRLMGGLAPPNNGNGLL